MKRWILLLTLTLLSACSTLGLEKPKVSLVDIKPSSKSTLFEQAFDVSLRISNPNGFALSGKGVKFTLQVDDKRLADGMSNKAFEIPARSSSVITVRMHTSLADWLKQLGNALASPNSGITYQLEGQITDVNGIASLPFSSKGNWSLAEKMGFKP
ncbi:LEA type 2 family protein [Craterilacuibacter sp. RT1T]|uniref:LEA type 2 family protein n=1 Tax=Craterilacuibacter sp. RT1T TaxID=2942211 RepID=UPI0020BEC841|nr:LEA type 2 family protein [Craterilacuibacter sp. RT1T]MCL6262090.1 LEA type 2 family protein [Craterilacuibacter sp. RT1T]